MVKQEKTRQSQIEEMTSIWAAGDEYSRGFLDGVIKTVINMASRDPDDSSSLKEKGA